MIKPVLQDTELLDDIKKAKKQFGALHIWWLGQSGFLGIYNNHCILFDPYLSDSLTKKYQGTEKEHIRMTEKVIEPHLLDFVDVVTSTHNHTDHLDHETLTPLIQANPEIQMVIPEANREFVSQRLETDQEWPVGLNDGTSALLRDLKFHGISAAHDEVEKDEQGRCKFMGFVVEIGPYTVYHSGDTRLHEGLEEKLKKFNIDVAILPINGRGPERKVAGNLWGKEAADLAKTIGAGWVIPCHFEMFTFNTASPDEFINRCKEIQQQYKVLKAGERLSLDGKNKEAKIDIKS